MAKIKILSTLVCLLFVLIGSNANAQRRIQKKLMGTWQLCNADSTIAVNLYKKGASRFKTFTKESVMACDFTNGKKQIVGVYYGTYEMSKGLYSETIKYTNGSYRNFLNNHGIFRIEIKKDLLFNRGANNMLNEIWKKVKD